MDNAPPLNLSTSIKIQESEDQDEQLNSNDKKEDNDYMLIPFGLNNLENVITITGEPVSDICKVESENNQTTLSDKEMETDIRLDSANDDVSSPKTIYHCSSCSKSFVRANQLRQHEKLHLSDQDEGCFTESINFVNLDETDALQVEVKSEDGIQNTNKSVTIIGEAKKSSNKFNEDEKKFKCTECAMSFLRELYLVTHMRKHTGEKPFKCEVCETRFKQMSHLTTHQRTHTQDRPYVCTLCNASFSQTGSLRRHHRSHTGEKPFKCDECDAVFVEKRNLSRHKLSHSGERPFKCDMCHSSFTQFIDLKRHKLSHFGIKPFKCELCGSSFSRKNNLRWHKLTHEGQTPYKCDICNVGFRIARDLKSHKRCHSESKTYYCDKCEVTFNQLTAMKRHMAIHEPTVSLLCNLCGETFYTQQALTKHIKRHGIEKKFTCDECPMSFTHAKPLRKHKIVVHNGSKSDRSNVKEIISDNVEKNDKIVQEEKVGINQNVSNDLNIHKVSTSSSYVPDKELTSTNPDEQITSLFLNQPENSSNVGRNMQQPTLVLTQPGLPPKTGRPPGNCQNHNAHVQTMVEGMYNDWQVWCFCENPDIPPINTIITPSIPVSLESPVISCSTVPSTSTNIDCSGSEVNVQAQSLSETSCPNSAVAYEANMSNYIANQDTTVRSDDYTKENFPIKEASTNQIMNGSLNESAVELEKDDIEKGLQSVPFQTNPSKESSLQKDLDMNKSPINLSDCNDTQGELRNADSSLFQMVEMQSKKGYFLTKLSSEEKYVEVDNNSIPAINKHPSRINSIAKSEESVVTFTDQNKMTLEKNYLSNNLDDKLLLNNEFDCPFLCADLANKPISHQPQLSTNGEALTKESNRCYDNEEFQVFDSVFQEYTSNISNDKCAPQQYCLTVNNPATGEIQIQSDLFSTKSNQKAAPIKKRKLASEIEGEEKPKLCPYCTKAFLKQSAYERHMRIHTGEKPLMCGLCRQCFSHKNSLIVHMRNHTGERPYVCTQCNASFTQKSNLRVHNRTHTGERPFSCNICDASFSQGSHLKAHERIHFNLRPFVCTTCNHAFTQKSALTRHEGKHSNKKNLKCTTCQATFGSRDMLKKHVASHNEKDPSTDVELESKQKRVKVSCEDTGTSCILHEEVIDNAESRPSSETMAKELKANTCNSEFEADNSNCKMKHRPAILQPTRRSRRILESASKTSVKKDSDFITGDLDEIDRAEEIEDQLIAAKPRNYRKKPNSAEVVQSWCFCEVAHGPNEPHTHMQNNTHSASESTQQKLGGQSQLMDNPSAPSNDTVYQLSIPNLSHAIVLQETQDGDSSLSMNKDDIMIQSSETEQRTIPITVSASSSHFNGSELCNVSTGDDQKLLSDNIRREGNRNLFESAAVINQVFTTGQLVSSEENTIYALESDVLNTETVVLNSSAGAIFFDVSSDGQMLTLPMQEPIVVGSASDIQNAINLTGSSSDLHSITPVSINLPIGNLQQNADGSIVSHNATETTTFDSNNIATAVNFVPLESNLMELFNNTNDNLDFDALKVSVSPRVSKKKKPTNVIVVPCKCVLCSREFAQKSGLHQHMKQEHPDSNYCSYCFDAFTTNVALMVHKSGHAAVNFCQECNSIFDTKTQLNRHLNDVHKVAKVKKDVVNCEPCGAKFSQISDYKRHMQSHLGIKPFVCSQCGAPFTRKSSLNKHERIHTGERPYTCSNCSTAFSYRYQFNRHRANQCTF